MEKKAFRVTKIVTFKSLDNGKEECSVRVSIQGRSIWISSINFPDLGIKKSSKEVELSIPLREHYSLKRKETENGAILMLLPPFDMVLSEV